MAFRYWYRDDADDLVEFTERVQVGWAERPGTTGLVMNAEEGSVGNSEIKVEDHDGTWGIRGHRLVYVTEDDCEYDDYGGVVWIGYSWMRTYERDIERTEAARIITLALVDINSVFERRIMVGSDANRPAESDVARVTWALSTNEGSLIDDDLYFSTAGPVDMDAVDYRGQSFRQIFDDVSLQSGKNWYLWRHDGEHSLWYGPRGTDDFTSDIRISNDLADIDDVTTFAPALMSQLTRDPSRVYSGIYRAYASSYVYTQNEATATAFARRDTFASSGNVKTKLKAVVRNTRELSDISTEEDVIKTSIVVPRAQTNAVVAGQRIQVKYTHFDTYEDFTWMRALNRTVRELGPDQVEIAMDLTRDEPVADSGAGVGAVYGILRRTVADGYRNDVHFDFVGDAPNAGYPTQPTVGLISPITDVDTPWAGHPFSGWLIGGDGFIDVTFYTQTIGIDSDHSVTFRITLNGGTMAEDTQAGPEYGYGRNCLLTIDNLPVSAGDVLAAVIAWDPPEVPFARSPRGTGQDGERLEITGGSLV